MAQTTASTSNQIRDEDKLRGSSFLAIQSALPVFQAHGLNPAQYRVVVSGAGHSAVTVFVEKESQARSVGVRQGQELSPADLSAAMSQLDPAQPRDAIQATSIAPVAVAVGALRRFNPDLNHYLITLARDKESMFVIFTDADAPVGGFGSSGKRPGYEVQLNAQNLTVVRSNLIR